MRKKATFTRVKKGACYSNHLLDERDVVTFEQDTT